jgi:phosphatidylinositol alpha-1,6-mannosyltransferase
MVFAAITLDPAGGGVAAASRMMWRVIHDRWQNDARLMTLRDDGVGTERASLLSRLRFATSVASAEVRGPRPGLLFSHLSLGRVQQWFPARMRKPYMVYLHGIEAWRPLSRADRDLLDGASLLMANSGYTARRVAEAQGLKHPIEVCPLALAPDGTPPNTHRIAQWRDRIGALAVLTVGRMDAAERYKGHDQLLEAWPSVKARVPGARLVFAGTGDDVARLVSKAQHLGLGHDVVFTGFLEQGDLDALYAASAVFAMPSRDEGFGLVYLEAMSHGLPCIGSVHDAAGDVIADGTSGYLVDQADARGLAARIADLLDDSARREAMGAEGLARLRRQFTYPHFRDRLLTLIDGPGA